MNALEDGMKVDVRRLGGTLIGLVLVAVMMGQAAAPRAQQAQTKAQAPPPKAQTRPHGQRLKVDPALITVEDGDNVLIRWSDKDTEIVRILGIDTPEIRRLEHNLPYDQPFGLEAKAFAQGAFAAATDVELIRSPTLDPFDRTLAYLFVNGRNFSVLAIKAKYSGETVGHYGDNGLPKEAAEVTAAAKEAGSSPLPFEPPYQFRARMRALTESLKQSGHYPSN
jgi:endonuclease YncB( thermonuclease family)